MTFQRAFVIGQLLGYISFNNLLTYKGHPAPDVPIDPRNDLAFLPYSSGTTGKFTCKQERISIRTKANRPLRDRNRNTLPFDSRMTVTLK